MSPLRVLPLLLLSSLFVVACKKESPSEAKPELTSPQALGAAAEQTLQRLPTEAAHWTAIHHLESGDRMEVAILQDASRRRFAFTLLREDRRDPLALIVEKDGYWYVTDGEISGVYRPYMAPLRTPALYMYLARSELQFFSAEGADAIGELQGVSDGVATFRRPFPEEVTAALEQRAVAADEAGFAQSGEAARSAAKEGLLTSVHVQSGVITRAGLPGVHTLVEGPTFVESPGDEAFDTGELVPGLLTGAVEGETETMVMIGHCLLWRPGQPPCDLDTHLLELNRGSLRRVPFATGTSLPGTFLKNRVEVVVVGTGLAGGMRPFRIHLDGGAQLPLGGAPLATGMTLFPRLSPDGETLVATWMPATGMHEAAQVVRFDTRGGDATAIGEPMPHSHVQWMPDGQSLLLVLREQAPGAGEEEAAAAPKPVLARLGLDGSLTRLREGDQPLVIGADAMLFFDVAAKRWQRAKLDGTGVQRFGNGHADLTWPTLSPDGTSLIFLRSNETGVMEPVRVDIAGRQVTSVMPEPGLWAWPVW